MNLAIIILDYTCGTCYIQNGDGGMRNRLSDPLQMGQFNLCPDPELEEISNLKREQGGVTRGINDTRFGWVSLLGPLIYFFSDIEKTLYFWVYL